jgi:hypothetical protein
MQGLVEGVQTSPKVVLPMIGGEVDQFLGF